MYHKMNFSRIFPFASEIYSKKNYWHCPTLLVIFTVITHSDHRNWQNCYGDFYTW